MGQGQVDPKVIWAPHEGSQTRFLTCPIKEILYEGTRGPGKTDALLMKFAQHVGRGYGEAWRGIIFRREYKHLDDVVAKSKKWFKRIFPKARFLSSKGDYKWVFPDGEELLLRAMKDPDDYWNYHGHEYPFIGWEELTNWPNDLCYTVMKACNRSSTMGVPRFYCSTANPYGAGHGWVKERFIDIGPPETIVSDDEGNKRVRIHGYLEENSHLMEADPAYAKELDAIENPELRKAWREGDWDIVVGGFLQGVWSHQDHVVEPFEIPAHWPRWRAMDWGYAKPYSIGWYAMSPEGVIYRYREMYGYGGKADHGSREEAPVVAKRVYEAEKPERKAKIKLTKNPADDAIWSKDGRIHSIESMFRKKPYRIIWTKAGKGAGSRERGAQVVIAHLRARTFKVFNTCKHFIRTVPILMPDDNNWEDVDTAQEDHAWDELRYSLVSRHRVADQDYEKKNPKPGTFDHMMQVTEQQRGRRTIRILDEH